MNTHSDTLVSVVIAFLNEERFLEEAIKSVIDQDYVHWQLLLVDDGSTDRSTQIALDYAASHAGKIIYCEHEKHINKGLSASRNAGIKKANGGLIAFLDADDVWLPGKLTNQVNIFQQHPGLGMVAEGSNYWYSWVDRSNRDVVIPVGAPPGKVYAASTLYYELYPLGKGAAPCPSALMLSKDAITRAGGFEESFIKEFAMYEDQAFLGKIYLREQVYISAASNNLYRQRPGSIVQTVHSNGHYQRVRKYFLEWFEAYLHRNNVQDARLKKLLNKSLLFYREPMIYFLKFTLPVKAVNFLRRRFRA